MIARTGWRLCMVATIAVGCGSNEAGDDGTRPRASSSGALGPLPIQVGPISPHRDTIDPNPLGLPAKKIDLAPGARVYAVPARMLSGAKLGSSFMLRASLVEGRDGDDLRIDGRDGPSYKVHPSYVIPVTPGKRPRVDQPVIAEWAGALRHGVVRRFVKDRIVVRFTDTDDSSDRSLQAEQVMVQSEGFRPGNYALRRSGADHVHLLLVSALGDVTAPPRSWLALGFGGASVVVPESELTPVPTNFTPKEGATVWAEHLGKMREAVVKSVDREGLCTVRFDRAGRVVERGWGLVMPPIRE